MDVQTLVPRLKELLKDADLNTTTSKMLRKQLEQELSLDLTLYKKEVDDLILSLIVSPEEDDILHADAELAAKLQEEENLLARGRSSRRRAAAPKPKAKPRVQNKERKKSGFTKPVLLTGVLAEFLGEDQMPRTMVVKKLWEYIKSHDLQDPADKRYILCDDALQILFGGKKRVNSFGMNKFLSPMMKTAAETVEYTDIVEEESMDEPSSPDYNL
jgi:upstream activation factor subunit UAF30